MIDRICALTGADDAEVTERLQTLWSGYGAIERVALRGGTAGATIIVKRIAPPTAGTGAHPRGWNTTRSHQRKLRSYEVEAAFYRDWASRTPPEARVARCLGTDTQGPEGHSLILLEDLDAAGFGQRHSSLSDAQAMACIRWLAAFHARFMGDQPKGLWQEGTYWHLATRPDELDALNNDELKAAATNLDAALRRATFQTLVHGDAKVANFCFSSGDGAQVAAVDFQYVGGGCGVQDLAYFIGSILDDAGCERHAASYVDTYFDALRERLAVDKPGVDAEAAEREGRSLYAVAWADFIRWLAGWAPRGDHVKLHGYAWRMVQQGMASVAEGR